MLHRTEGQDLLTYFPDAEINVVDSISTGGDIQIYIGTDSTNVPAGSDSTTDTEDETVTDSSLDDESVYRFYKFHRCGGR